jgi:hypothetical protein
MAFLGATGPTESPLGLPADFHSPLGGHPPTSLDAATPSPRSAYPHASPPGSTLCHRYGYIIPFSIAYGYYALDLGPTNPTRIHLASETLGFRRTRFSRVLTLLIPAFALPIAPASLTAHLHRHGTLPYPIYIVDCHSFGNRLEPR